MSLSRRCLSANISQRYFSLRMLAGKKISCLRRFFSSSLSLSLSLQLVSQKKEQWHISERIGWRMLRHCVISNRNFGEFYDPKPYVVFQGKSSSRFTMFVLAISANNFQRTPEIIILSILSDYTFLPSENNPTNVSNKYMYTFFYINIQFI